MERKIKDLNPGESAWTMPWALHEAQGKKWLHPEYSAECAPWGPLQMKVTAYAPKEDKQTKRYCAYPDNKKVAVDLAPFGGPEKTEETFEHETWLEFHDRLVREYFDGERELLKEIYPDRVSVRRRSIQFRTPWPGLAAAWFLVGLVNLFALDNLALAIVWFALATGVLGVSIVRR